MVEQGAIKELAVLFNDKEVMARKNAHQTIEMLSELPFGNIFSFVKVSHNILQDESLKTIGAEEIVNLKLIQTLVEKLKTEIDEIKVYMTVALECKILSFSQNIFI